MYNLVLKKETKITRQFLQLIINNNNKLFFGKKQYSYKLLL